jgi:hypothetical protein
LPELGKIADEGILFRNCFASGDRSDKGLIAILSAFPAQPTASVMTMPKKTAHLPILSQISKTGISYSMVLWWRARICQY